MVDSPGLDFHVYISCLQVGNSGPSSLWMFRSSRGSVTVVAADCSLLPTCKPRALYPCLQKPQDRFKQNQLSKLYTTEAQKKNTKGRGTKSCALNVLNYLFTSQSVLTQVFINTSPFPPPAPSQASPLAKAKTQCSILAVQM